MNKEDIEYAKECLNNKIKVEEIMVESEINPPKELIVYKTLRDYIEYLEQKVKELEDIDLTQVYTTGYYRGKDEAETQLNITRDKLLEDITKENIQLKKRIEELEGREQKVKNRINEALEFAKMGDCEKYYSKQIQCLENVLNLYEE